MVGLGYGLWKVWEPTQFTSTPRDMTSVMRVKSNKELVLAKEEDLIKWGWKERKTEEDYSLVW